MRAKEYYGKAMANNGHGSTNALARPVARKKLAGGKSHLTNHIRYVEFKFCGCPVPDETQLYFGPMFGARISF
jgi:hypothetical protein